MPPQGFRLAKILLFFRPMQAEQTIDTVRSALGRVLSPLVAWIPDVTAIPRQRQIAIAAVVSVLLHLVIFSGLVVHELVWSKRAEPIKPAPPARLQVMLVPKPQLRDEEDPLFKERRAMLDAKGLDPSTEKPEDAKFESDRNMKEGSELPAKGMLPLPSQEGRTDRLGYEFRNQEVRLGTIPDAPPETLRPPDPSQQEPAGAPPVPTPLFTPQPVAPDALASADKAKPDEALPDPAKTAKATPPPFKTSTRTENTMAMLTATPRPKVAMPTPAPPSLPATMPAPPKSVADVFNSNLRKTGVEGSINTKGKNGVNAIGTPMGIYRRRLSQQLESLWTLKRPGDNAEVGTVRVNMRLRDDGTVESARVPAQDSAASPHHTEICLQVIRELRPMKMPPEAAPLLDDGILEITFSFSIYGL